tara:strand:+ start:187 stop:567 length:381 start_codon:yes stop_codon:yes gene_type:complete
MEEINLKMIQDLFESGSLELIATQPGVCLPMLQRIYKKMKVGIEFADIRVNDSRIVDGHHRYICSKLLNIDIGINNNYPIPSTAESHKWEVLVIDEFDFETEEEIKNHNLRDAEINDVDFDFLNSL